MPAMTDPERPFDRLLRASAPAGRLVSGFGVFCCAWLAFRTDDWNVTLAWSGAAFLCALAGMGFQRLSGPGPR